MTTTRTHTMTIKFRPILKQLNHKRFARLFSDAIAISTRRTKRTALLSCPLSALWPTLAAIILNREVSTAILLSQFQPDAYTHAQCMTRSIALVRAAGPFVNLTVIFLYITCPFLRDLVVKNNDSGL